MFDVHRAVNFYKKIRLSYAGSGKSFNSAPVTISSKKVHRDISLVHRRLRRVVIENKDFEDLIKHQDRDFKLREEALKHYMKMVDTLEKETDLWMFVQNSYRSFEDQTRIFNNYVAQDGLEEANRYSAMPGHSEHQSGLTIDVRTDTHNYTDFSETKQYEWVKDNAHRFGYIIRYPEDKEEITKYMPEAWHLRYVGKDIATYLYENELTFDEYKIQNKN